MYPYSNLPMLSSLIIPPPATHANQSPNTLSSLAMPDAIAMPTSGKDIQSDTTCPKKHASMNQTKRRMHIHKSSIS
jgi:hypothetical protein